MSSAEHIRIRGTVQGVGFRPTVARLAREAGLQGWVRNDGEGVLVALEGPEPERDRFVRSLLADLPPLARVDGMERTAADPEGSTSFHIADSERAAVRTPVSADAAPCLECTAEVADPFSRRYRYPFTNCTHCGPRFTIAQGIPWDRPRTTMAGFELCPDCRAEYEDEGDRRFHAQPIACGRCGPTARLVRTDGAPVSYATLSMLDDVDAVRTLLQRGQIVAVKGLGGYQLCCDATNEAAVALLRERKGRPDKPLALMAENLDTIRRYCTVSEREQAALESPANPIVLLRADGPEQVAPSVAPGQHLLGFLLPATPLHQLMLRRIERPIVCTSGNLVEEPQCTDDEDALARLGGIADWALVHDRPIAHRVDDSVVREMAGAVRVLRRARGYAPAPVELHPGYRDAEPLTALGAHLKSTFCFLRDGRAILSPHIGDLDDARTLEDYEHLHGSLAALYEHDPARIVADRHPGYATSTLARTGTLPVVEVAHHHAHLAACMAENGLGPDDGPVLGLVLDGLGLGPDDALWGGELLVADARSATRVGGLPAVPLIGGDGAAREPWRSALAHLVHALGWEGLEAVPELAERRSSLVEQAFERGPPASSAGRLFDAVAWLLGVAPERISFEAQAPMALESLAARWLEENAPRAPLPIGVGTDGAFDLRPLWEALLAERDRTDAAELAARFHLGLAAALAAAARPHSKSLEQVALSGGVWQNAVLLEQTVQRLEADGWTVLLHRSIPPNDGCVALGQAVLAASRTE